MNKIYLAAIISVIAFILSASAYVLYDYFEDQEDLEQLQLVLNLCECHTAERNMRVCASFGASYWNSTHYIDNNSCEWEESHCIFGTRYFPTSDDGTQKIISDAC